MNEIVEKIIDIVCSYQGMNKDGVNGNSNLISDIGLSSFDVVSLTCQFEEKFGLEIPDRKIRTFQTIKDVAEFIYDNV